MSITLLQLVIFSSFGQQASYRLLVLWHLLGTYELQGIDMLKTSGSLRYNKVNTFFIRAKKMKVNICDVYCTA